MRRSRRTRSQSRVTGMPTDTAPVGYGADLQPVETVTVTASRIRPDVPWWALALGLVVGAGLGAWMQGR